MYFLRIIAYRTLSADAYSLNFRYRKYVKIMIKCGLLAQILEKKYTFISSINNKQQKK